MSNTLELVSEKPAATGSTNAVDETKAGTYTTTSILDTDLDKAISTDGDDALKLAGIEARYFDDKYYSRVRRKIVRLLPFRYAA